MKINANDALATLVRLSEEADELSKGVRHAYNAAHDKGDTDPAVLAVMHRRVSIVVGMSNDLHQAVNAYRSAIGLLAVAVEAEEPEAL